MTHIFCRGLLLLSLTGAVHHDAGATADAVGTCPESCPDLWRGVARLVMETTVAPEIPSTWRAKRLTGEGAAKAERACRLGEQIATALAEEAKRIRTDDVADVIERVGTHTDLIRWLSATDGYGNLLLSRRANDMALLGFLRVTADLSVAEDTVDRLFGGFTGGWKEVDVRVHVLNLEAGMPVFSCNTEEEMEKRVQQGLYVMAVRRKAEIFAPEGPPVTEEQLGIRKGDPLLDAVSFFEVCFEDRAGPWRAVDAWRFNEHRTIAGGLESVLYAQAVALYVFRRCIGAFPKVLVRPPDEERQIKEAKRLNPNLRTIEDMASSPREAAFEYAWYEWLKQQPISADERETRGGLGSFAAYVLDRVEEGRLMDNEASQER